ncbi:hypothetical protein [Aeromonas caviae]|uniref:hypothetical protein n=1 Tax=Aeromonas TaxID=642 RepID=UPI001EEF7AF5|nr:hypothetical protein [Aeromonas caviae]ULH03268.1 hypothetical protein MF133_02205 [Aeromonas caviae]ULH03279.1 hypothetical protein MF133_02270 [Aeromonas caviae]
MTTSNTYAYEKLLSALTYIYERGTPAQSLNEVYGQLLAQISATNDLPIELRPKFEELCALIEGLPDSLYKERDLEVIRDSMFTLYGLLFQYPGYTPHK